MAARRTIGTRIAPPRFILFFALMLVGSVIASGWLERTLAIMAGFDIAALGFIIACANLLDDEAMQMRKSARENVGFHDGINSRRHNLRGRPRRSGRKLSGRCAHRQRGE